MIKLQEIIRQLNTEDYSSVENKLIKTKADNFLFVLRTYRDTKTSDRKIIENMGIVPNSFYVLKSRLYGRIQEELTSKIDTVQNDIFSQLALVHHVCYSSPAETTIAFLHKLEKDLLAENASLVKKRNEAFLLFSARNSVKFKLLMHLHSELNPH